MRPIVPTSARVFVAALRAASRGLCLFVSTSGEARGSRDAYRLKCLVFWRARVTPGPPPLRQRRPSLVCAGPGSVRDVSLQSVVRGSNEDLSESRADVPVAVDEPKSSKAPRVIAGAVWSWGCGLSRRSRTSSAAAEAGCCLPAWEPIAMQMRCEVR